MIKIGDRIVINREPISGEDPDSAWIDEFEEIIGYHGTVLSDECPYALDSMYARVEVDDLTDFYLPIPVLTILES